MKRIIIVLLTFAFATGVSAQHGFYKGGGGRAIVTRPRVSVAIGGYIPWTPYSYYGSPYSAYGPMFGYGYRPFEHRATRLDLKIEDIRNDYSDRIWSVKHDDNLSRKEKKARVHSLKHERDQAIIDAKRNYYKY